MVGHGWEACASLTPVLLFVSHGSLARLSSYTFISLARTLQMTDRNRARQARVVL